MTWNSWLISPLVTGVFFELGILLCFELIVKLIIDHHSNYDRTAQLINIFTALYVFAVYLFMEIDANYLSEQTGFANFRLIILFTVILFMESLFSRIIIALAIVSELIIAYPLSKMIVEVVTILILIGLLAFVHSKFPQKSFTLRASLAVIAGALFWSVVGVLHILPWYRVISQFVYFVVLILILFWAIISLDRTNKLALLNSRYAKYDALTGVRNLRYFRDSFDKAIDKARKHESPLVLIALDIDHFKHINDTYGHLAGDAVLKQTTRKLMEITKTFDRHITIYRVGGEEFNILVPNVDIHHGAQIASSCRQEISGTPVTFGDQIITITLSLGVADLKADDTSLTLYNRADQNLYLSKGRGRNLVTVNFKTLFNDEATIPAPHTDADKDR